MPGSAEKICAMPTASDTAPPVRPITLSPTAASIAGTLTGTICWPSNTRFAYAAGGTLIAK